MMWPIGADGDWLVGALREASSRANGVLSSVATTTVEQYLRWVSDEVRMFQSKLAPSELDRLFTTARYWATLANPTGVLTGMQAITNEVQHQQRLLTSTADAVEQMLGFLNQHRGDNNTYVVPDTNFWVEHNDSFNNIDWHKELSDNQGPGRPKATDRINVIVPMLVIDELDGLSHRRETRPKVAGVNRFLYEKMGNAPWKPTELDPGGEGRGAVTVQVLFDSLRHVRLPHNDDEIIDRLRAIRDLVGASAEDCYFLSYDRGAVFRATAVGHMTRLLTKQSDGRSKAS